MAKEFSIPQLIGLASSIHYVPALGVAVNKLLSAVDKDSYDVALKEATETALGLQGGTYTVNERYTIDSHGYGKASQLAGLPIYMPVILEKTKPSEEDVILESGVVDFARTRNIVTTVVQGRDSSIKEFINNGDWSISVSGIICKKGFGYPKDEVVALNQFLEKKQTLSIVHEVLNALGIFEIVVTDYSFPKTAYINCQQYNFNCLSDTSKPTLLEDSWKF